MTEDRKPRRWAVRGKAKRIQLSVQLPPHQVRYVRNLAVRLNQSVSATFESLIEDAIHGTSGEDKAS